MVNPSFLRAKRSTSSEALLRLDGQLPIRRLRQTFAAPGCGQKYVFCAEKKGGVDIAMDVVYVMYASMYV